MRLGRIIILLALICAIGLVGIFAISNVNNQATVEESTPQRLYTLPQEAHCTGGVRLVDVFVDGKGVEGDELAYFIYPQGNCVGVIPTQFCIIHFSESHGGGLNCVEIK